MTSAILTNEISQVCSEAHVRNCRFVIAPFLDRQAFKENEALSVEQLCTESLEEGRKIGKRESFLPQVSTMLQGNDLLEQPWLYR